MGSTVAPEEEEVAFEAKQEFTLGLLPLARIQVRTTHVVY